MYDKLVEKLRDDSMLENCEFDFVHKYMHEAADAIEELQKQLRDEKVANVNLTGWLAEEHANKCPHYIRNIQYIGNGSLCDKWECKIASLPNWIPVTERLPEIHTDVLVVDKARDMAVGSLEKLWDGEVWVCPFSAVDDEHCRITHWMPLPQPPESGEA